METIHHYGWIIVQAYWVYTLSLILIEYFFVALVKRKFPQKDEK